ncbi:MAG: beta-ketoacyl-[Paludibacteraceae bacterium]|nr:beta-ketoacyl-[acyl-carrier-protein] synthase family protein [Paludibacteraceae bacterium]
MMKRVVVTGMGIWSCIGQDLQTVTENLKQGRSGIGVRPERKELGYHSLLSGIVPRPDLKPLLDRRLRNMLSEEAEYAYMATREALNIAQLDENYCLQNAVGVVFGNDTSNQSVLASYLGAVGAQNTFMLGSGMAFQALTSNVAMTMANVFHLRGANFTTASACASSAQAIALATMLIQMGQQSIVLAGGAQETNDKSMIAFDGVNTLSKRNDDPLHASRPFCKERDGLVPSGGASALVLEEYEHAVARGANILAEVVGYGFSQNSTPLGQPSAEAEYEVMQRALKNANLLPSNIDYVNAHATSTIAGDIEEAKALTRLFGKSQIINHKSPMISSTKSMTGHENWMAGASEAVYSILMMQNNFVAPNINLENVIDEAKDLNIVRDSIYTPINTVLSNSFGFGGTNCTLILKRI